MRELFRRRRADSVQVKGYKRVFSGFYQWFLKNRYLRHLIHGGKMAHKEAYLEYKNKYLLNYGLEESEAEDERSEEVRWADGVIGS